jgi:anti-anti-sigma regulatory factor
MRWHRSGRELWVELLGDFNYERVLKLKEIMKEDDTLILNLQNCSFVDTEAVDFLYNLKIKGVKFKLLNSPPLLKKVCEALEILELSKVKRH